MREKIENIFTRDNLTWSFGFIASLLGFVLAHTSLIPAGWQAPVKDVSATIGFISGKLGWSPLNVSDKI